jgi:hypothetical protein
MRRLAACVAAIAALVAGSATASTPPPGAVYVTRDSLGLPVGCSPREVASTVRLFLGAINSRSESNILRYLARPGSQAPAFRWVSVTGPEGHFVAYSPSEAAHYLAGQGKFFQLRQLNVARSRVPKSVGLGVSILRYLGTTESVSFHGKAEIHCPSKTVYVWSITEGTSSSCVAPSWWSAMHAPLVCARGGRATNADEVAQTYRRPGATSAPLEPRCTLGPVERKLFTLLRAYNVGDGKAFARGFPDSRAAVLRVDDLRLRARSGIASYVSRTYPAGVGWTLEKLEVPMVPAAPYRLLLSQVRRQRQSHLYNGELFVDCRTGLIRRLVLTSFGP